LLKKAISNVVASAVVIIVLVASVAGTYYATSASAGTKSGTVTTTVGGATVTTTLTNQPALGTIKIGFMTSLSGVATDLGNQMLQGAQFAVDQVNSKGGVCFAGSCYKIVLDVVDNGDTTDITVASANKLIQDQVSAVIGFVYSGGVFATDTTLMAHKIPVILTSASAVTLLTQVQSNYSTFKYLFRVVTNDSGLSYTGYQFMGLVNAKSYGYIAEDFLYAHFIGQYLGNFTKAGGINNLFTDYTPFSATDYSSEILKIDTQKPAVVVGVFSGANGFAFLKQYKADPVASHIPVFFAGGPWGSKNTIDSLNSAQPGSADYIADGTLGWNIPITKVTGQFCDAISKKLSTSCNVGTHGVNYDAVNVLVNAIQAAGTLNPDALVTALQQTDYIGASGRIVFTSAHQALLAPGYVELPIIEWINGQVSVVHPQKFAAKAYVPPP